MAGITAFEAVAGKPLDAIVGGKHNSGTTIGSLVGGQSAHTATHRTSPTPTPAHADAAVDIPVADADAPRRPRPGADSHADADADGGSGASPAPSARVGPPGSSSAPAP